MNKLRVNWNTYTEDIYKLVEQLRPIVSQNQLEFLGVYGPPRGGSIPATILSHSLDIPYIINLTDLALKTKNVGSLIVVDDISCKGETLTAISERIDSRIYDNITTLITATLYYRTTSKYKPTFYVNKLENQDWIVFPYEVE